MRFNYLPHASNKLCVPTRPGYIEGSWSKGGVILDQMRGREVPRRPARMARIHIVQECFDRLICLVVWNTITVSRDISIWQECPLPIIQRIVIEDWPPLRILLLRGKHDFIIDV